MGLSGHLFFSRAFLGTFPAKLYGGRASPPKGRAVLTLGRNRTRDAQVFAELGLCNPLDADAGFGVLATGRPAGFPRDRWGAKSVAHCQSHNQRRIRPDDPPLRVLLLRAERACLGASHVQLASEHRADGQPCSSTSRDDGRLLLSLI